MFIFAILGPNSYTRNVVLTLKATTELVREGWDQCRLNTQNLYYWDSASFSWFCISLVAIRFLVSRVPKTLISTIFTSLFLLAYRDRHLEFLTLPFLLMSRTITHLHKETEIKNSQFKLVCFGINMQNISHKEGIDHNIWIYYNTYLKLLKYRYLAGS